MAKTAVIALQAVWDCRWARLAYPINRDTDHWLCVRDGNRHATSAHECETCPHWEMKAEERAGPAVQMEAAIRLAPRGQALVIALRVILLLNAAVLFVWGFSILSRPLFIPMTIVLWLCAAALTGAAAFAPFNSSRAQTVGR